MIPTTHTPYIPGLAYELRADLNATNLKEFVRYGNDHHAIMSTAGLGAAIAFSYPTNFLDTVFHENSHRLAANMVFDGVHSSIKYTGIQTGKTIELKITCF